MHTRALLLLIVLGAALGYAGYRWLATPPRSPTVTARPAPVRTGHPLPQARTLDTVHYRIRSTASAAQTRQVGDAVEQLHHAYRAFFGQTLAATPGAPRLSLVLYRDQAEFKAHNRSRPWAEAYYLAPDCHAYYVNGARNPHHWMLHEATHQLSREVAGFPKERWSDEGLASYFGASRIERGALVPGRIDHDAYPIWWLPSLSLSGDLQQDLRQRRLIPLRDVIAGTGPDIGQYVNVYYIQFWSLTHFLFHYDGGRYATAYRTLIAEGGGLERFEARIGPVARVEREWYRYLQHVADLVRHSAPADGPHR